MFANTHLVEPRASQSDICSWRPRFGKIETMNVETALSVSVSRVGVLCAVADYSGKC